MNTPLVSIGVPNLNKRPYLPARMETLLSQTFTDYEIIVCDSYSNDGSWEYLQQFAGNPRVRLHQVPRAGIYAGWNDCVTRATGRYVYIATSDDTAEPSLLENLVAALERFPDVHLATCNCHFINETGQRTTETEFGPDGRLQIFDDWLQRPHRRHGLSEFVSTCVYGPTYGPITAALFRRTLFDQSGMLFPAGGPAMADLEWGLRACLHTDAIHVPEDLATLRVYATQATQQVDWANGAWECVGMVRRVCREFAAKLPAQMQTSIAHNHLARVMELRAFNALELYPGSLLKHPARTLANLGRGFARHPGLTLSHLARGARWRNRITPDFGAAVRELLAEFNLPPICSAIP